MSDFGLYELRDWQPFELTEFTYESLLWTAPEFIRDCGLCRAPCGSQEGDIYSFGIILHEMMTRQGPFCLFESSHETAEDIITRIYNGMVRPQKNLLNSLKLQIYRPPIEHLQCQNYIIETMQLCWAEQPQIRPNFRTAIRHKLKPMFGTIIKRNIMDHVGRDLKNKHHLI